MSAMVQLIGLAVIVLLSVELTACDTSCIATMEKMGYAERDILSSRVKSARNAQEDAKKEIQIGTRVRLEDRNAVGRTTGK